MKYSTFLDSIFRETKGHSKLRQVLFDGVTGLPILPLVFESLKDLANEQHRIGLIFLDTTRLEALEDTYGWESTDQLLNHLRMYLDSVSGQFPPFQIMAVHRMPGDSFLLIISSRDPHRSITNERLSEISSKLQLNVNEYVQTQLDPSLHPFARVFNGHAILEYNSNVRFERLLSRAVNQAFHGAVNQEERARQNQIQELQELVNLRNIRILFQP